MALFSYLRGSGFIAGILFVAGIIAVSVMTGPSPAVAADVQPISSVRIFSTAPVDFAAARAEDQEREEIGLAPRFALTEQVNITPETDGTWEARDSRFDLWRLRINSPGALSLNLGFTEYRLPKGSRLTIRPPDSDGPSDPRGVRTFTNRDNEAHGELWTPVVLGDDIVIELVIPRESRHDYDLQLTAINMGYRFFGESAADATDKSEPCSVDVICPVGDDWRLEIASVGVISTGGSTYCSGFMINNTAEDGRPFFMTADHCGIGTNNAPSLVVYWNFESPVCGQHGGGSLSQYMTGSTFLAGASATDFTLVEMDDPVDSDHMISFAGWNRSNTDATSAVAIHHPATDEKSISFEDDPTTTTSYYGTSSPGDGTHIRVGDWDLGSTEGGSSGSPLFDQNHRVIGQLHGGDASCYNNLPDWYGRFAATWPFVSQYLDPVGTGAVTTDTYAPFSTTMRVNPSDGAAFEGLSGGPFTPATVEYILSNHSDVPLTFQTSADVAWVDVTPSSAFIPEGGSLTIAVSTNAAAGDLALGQYDGLLTILNMTDGGGNTTRPLQLTVGVPELVYSFPMNTDPGWSAETEWEFGQPLGAGGEYGFRDPFNGFTGTSVYGYNLAGDYENDLPERHLVTGAIDCSQLDGVTLKFKRWLNVEEAAYDHASLSVSNNGVTFNTIWNNIFEVTDTNWIPVEYDISSMADGQSHVYLRWTMGSTDGSYRYSGWNIDDVEIWGLKGDVTAVGIPDRYRLSVGNHPNPFNPMTTIGFVLEKDGHASVSVYDLKGRRVRGLIDGSLNAGPHSVPWDGMNEAGQRAGSGVYLVRILAGGKSAEHKMVLLK